MYNLITCVYILKDNLKFTPQNALITRDDSYTNEIMTLQTCKLNKESTVFILATIKDKKKLKVLHL